MPSSGTPANVVLRVGIVALTLGTALIHLSLNFPDLGFMLNGLGYLTLLAALCLPVPQVARHRDIVRWVLIGYAALTILLWILLGDRTYRIHSQSYRGRPDHAAPARSPQVALVAHLQP
ncbi:MAG: hypothetical protein M3P92_00145 [Actinomycetota bacterium]|nr:hypothetical protein [Actinomycetota bacterium]